MGVGVCHAQGAPKPHTSNLKPVSIKGFAFAPAELSLLKGDTVVWVNGDALPHTSAADSGAWSSPELRQGERFVFVAKQTGRFPYHCAAHPVMRAVLVVREER
jgi:plastocyanin